MSRKSVSFVSFVYFCPDRIIKINTLKLPNIVVRILSGAVFVALLLGGILNEYTFAVIFTVITALSLYEFYGLVQTSAKVGVSRILNIVAGICLFSGSFLYFSLGSTIGFALYAVLIMAVFIGELYFKREDPIKSLAYGILGQVYIAVPFSLANYLAFAHSSGQYHYLYILAVLIFIWVNDSFAYLTGIAFGKHRLFERISPKKSWEGFIGGAVFSIAVSVLFYHFFDELPMPAWMGFAAVTVAFGTWGDLIESLFKRTLGVKDSGSMIPGHGGILDRFDSTILTIPAVVVYLLLVG